MIDWLRMTFGLCQHHWRVYNTINVYWYEDDPVPYKTKYILRCDKCGNIKSKTA